MVFDASAPIKRKKNRPSVSMESALDEERREVLALVEARAGITKSQSLGPSGTSLEEAYSFDMRSPTSSTNRMFASRKAQTGPMVTQAQTQQPQIQIEGSRSVSFGASIAVPLVDRQHRPSSSPPRTSLMPGIASNAHRRLSEAALAQSHGSLSKLPPSATQRKRAENEVLEKDHDPEKAIESDSDEEGDEDEEDEIEEEAASERKKQKKAPLSPHPLANLKAARQQQQQQQQRQPMLLVAAAEAERLEILEAANAGIPKVVVSNTSTSPNPNPNPNPMPIPNPIRKSKVRPNTSFTDDSRNATPRTSEDESDPHEASATASKGPNQKKAKKNLEIVASARVDADDRLICSLVRGDHEAAVASAKRTRTYLVAVDLSNESKYALEWTVGTVLRNGDTMRIVDAIERDDRVPRTDVQRAAQRASSLDTILGDVTQFLSRTSLTVRVECEVMHHIAPKHLITEIIDLMDPAMVILGSRGRGSLQGILLGSFSNYIVNKSSVPVMVARKRLRATRRRRVGGVSMGMSKGGKGMEGPLVVRMANNAFATAIVD